MRKVNDFGVQALKEKCKSLDLISSGTKVELFSRLIENDPTGEWMQDNDVHATDETSNVTIVEETTV